MSDLVDVHVRGRDPWPEVLCLGETMVLVTPTDPTSLEHADTVRLDIGGAESTVALYLAELGRPTAWVSRLGADSLGARVLALLRRHGVDTSWVRLVGDAPTGVYFKDPASDGTGVLYYRDGSAASTMEPGDLDDLPLAGVRIVHISGITPALSTSCRAMVDQLLDRLAGTGTIVSFDVNHRAALWSAADAADVLLDIAHRCDLVFVGLDEAETLWGTTSPHAVRELLGKHGTLVVKDGAVGATELTAGATTFVPAPTVEVVEVVGAGDAFAAGYLDALLAGQLAEQRLIRGHQLAARALSSTSDFAPAMPVSSVGKN